MKGIFTITLMTFKDAVRNKLFYLAFFFVLFLIVFSALFSSVALADKSAVIKDFGLFGISFFVTVYIIIFAGLQIPKEISNKTILYLLSQPISRASVVIGKFFGVLLTSFSLIFLLTIILIAFNYFLGFGYDLTLFKASFFIFLQVVIVASFALMFSILLLNPILSGTLTFSLFLAGRSSLFINQYVQEHSTELSGKIINFISHFIPKFDLLDISDKIVYLMPIKGELYIWGLEYTLGIVLIVLALAVIFFNRKNIV